MRTAIVLLVAILAACGQAADKPADTATNALVPAAQAEDFYRSCIASKKRLDAPATPDNSFLQEFVPGVILHVPKCLEPNLDFGRLKQPAKAAALSMTFWYPYMTPSDSPIGTVETILQKERSEYVQQRHRFRVYVIRMWHVPPDSDSFVPGSKQPGFLFEPRPPRMELNRHCFKLVEGRCNDEMRRVNSGLEGITALHAEDWIKKHPEAGIHRVEEGGAYVANPESPYELLMDCSGLNGVHCQAHVYSKKHHFQYRMLFPSEAVEHTDSLLKAIDKMLVSWTAKET